MIKYRLYIGLLDADTKKQKIRTRKAVQLITKAVCSHTGGGTIWTARGVYTHANGDIVNENTIICETVTNDPCAVIYLMDWLRLKLNQESILIEAEGGLSIFYDRSDEAIDAINKHANKEA